MLGPIGNRGVSITIGGNLGSPRSPLLAMVLLSVSASSSKGPPGSGGSPVTDGGGGGMLRSKLPGNDGKI